MNPRAIPVGRIRPFMHRCPDGIAEWERPIHLPAWVMERTLTGTNY